MIGTGCGISGGSWMSIFRVHLRLVDAFRDKNGAHCRNNGTRGRVGGRRFTSCAMPRTSNSNFIMFMRVAILRNLSASHVPSQGRTKRQIAESGFPSNLKNREPKNRPPKQTRMRNSKTNFMPSSEFGLRSSFGFRIPFLAVSRNSLFVPDLNNTIVAPKSRLAVPGSSA